MFGFGKKKDVKELTKLEKQKALEIYDYEAKFAESSKIIIERISKFLQIDEKQVEDYLVYK